MSLRTGVGGLCRACVCVLWLVATCASAAAEGYRHQVRVVYAAQDGQAADLEKTLTDAVELPNITATVERVPSIDVNMPFAFADEEPAPLARIFVDVTLTERVRLFVVDSSGARVFARSLPRLLDNTALEDAQIGEVVRSAVQALAQGAVIGIAVSPAPAASSPTVSQASTFEARAATLDRASNDQKVSSMWTAGAFYGIGLRADGGAVAQGPGLYASWLRGRNGLEWGVRASAQYQPHRIERSGVSALLSTASLRAGPVLALPLSAATAAELSLAGGADAVHVSTESSRDDVAVSRGYTLWFAMLQSTLGLRYRAADNVVVAILAAVDFDLVDTRFILQRQGHSTQIEDPWTVRPSLLLGLGFY